MCIHPIHCTLPIAVICDSITIYKYTLLYTYLHRRQIHSSHWTIVKMERRQHLEQKLGMLRCLTTLHARMHLWLASGPINLSLVLP